MAWIPRSGLDSIEDVVWLPRLLEKARHVAARPAAGRLVDGYCYGSNDFIDKQVLAFLRTDDVAVSALVREDPDDSAVAITIVERSARSPEERIAFSRRLRRSLFDFALIEADEGRMAPGIKRTLIRVTYNRVIMPYLYAAFRRDERKRVRSAGL